MKKYDNSKPLVLIHVPKTAGISVKEVYKDWFGERLLFHYKGIGNKLPKKHILMKSNQEPKCIYGHFNRSKGFGVEHYYPEVEQFITILRDPFEMAVSGFFYVRKTNLNWRRQLSFPEGELREYLEQRHSGLLNFFPCEITLDNYREVIEGKFIEVGVTEFLNESMVRIAKKLNCPFKPELLKRLNVAKRDQVVPQELKESFKERHELEYLVYDYVLSKYS